MKILFDFEISWDEFDDLNDEFISVEYVENPSEMWSVYNEVVVDTKDLKEMEFDDWLQKYIDVGYSVVWDKFKNNYILTDLT